MNNMFYDPLLHNLTDVIDFKNVIPIMNHIVCVYIMCVHVLTVLFNLYLLDDLLEKVICDSVHSLNRHTTRNSISGMRSIFPRFNTCVNVIHLVVDSFINGLYTYIEITIHIMDLCPECLTYGIYCIYNVYVIMYRSSHIVPLKYCQLIDDG